MNTDQTPLVRQMIARYNELARLKAAVEAELVGVSNGLRLAGVLPPLRGRREIADPYTDAQARDFHRRYQRGERTEDVLAGERQYKRVKTRERRARAKTNQRRENAA